MRLAAIDDNKETLVSSILALEYDCWGNIYTDIY